MTPLTTRLRPGDLVEVKAPDEILQTLDVDGTLDHLPFMPEMIELCGKRFSVSRRVLKTCYTGLNLYDAMRHPRWRPLLRRRARRLSEGVPDLLARSVAPQSRAGGRPAQGGAGGSPAAASLPQDLDRAADVLLSGERTTERNPRRAAAGTAPHLRQRSPCRQPHDPRDGARDCDMAVLEDPPTASW